MRRRKAALLPLLLLILALLLAFPAFALNLGIAMLLVLVVGGGGLSLLAWNPTPTMFAAARQKLRSYLLRNILATYVYRLKLTLAAACSGHNVYTHTPAATTMWYTARQRFRTAFRNWRMRTLWTQSLFCRRLCFAGG